MAKMFGFEVKSVKEWRGHEGEPLSQGNVYFNGKKLGFWSMGDWGGPDNFDFDTIPFDAEIAKLAGQHPFEDWVGITPDLGALLGYLMNVRDDEKVYKKLVKQGSKAVVKCSNGWKAIFYGSNIPSMSVGAVAQAKAQAAKDLKCDVNDVTVKAFTTTDDFIVGEPLPVAAKDVKAVIEKVKAREKMIREWNATH